jgi:hypothetical protein
LLCKIDVVLGSIYLYATGCIHALNITDSDMVTALVNCKALDLGKPRCSGVPLILMMFQPFRSIGWWHVRLFGSLWYFWNMTRIRRLELFLPLARNAKKNTLCHITNVVPSNIHSMICYIPHAIQRVVLSCVNFTSAVYQSLGSH